MQYKPSPPELIFYIAKPRTVAQILLFPLVSTLFQRDVLVQTLLLQQSEGHHKIRDGPIAGSLKFK